MPSTRSSVRIWDLPTRLFHWAFAVCVIGAYVSVNLGGLYMDWHVRFGLATLGLVTFRLIWGFVGPRYARFSNFVRGPASVSRYLRSQAPVAGHTPLGALSVMAMLGIITFQAVSGLFVTDDIMVQGPLHARAPQPLVSWFTSWHRRGEWIIVGLVALHLCAICWYACVKRKRIVGPMITGDARAIDLPPDTPSSQDGPMLWLRALAIAAISAALVLWIQSLEEVAAFGFS